MKKIIHSVNLVFAALLLLVLACSSPVHAVDGGHFFYLEGLEIFKGTDFGPMRIGTAFAGEVFDDSMKKVGQWKATLNYRGADQVEVCGGTNDIVKLQLTVLFSRGVHAGNVLVLGMTDFTGTPDVSWDWAYGGPRCKLGGICCDACNTGTTEVACTDVSKIAHISDLNLAPQRGSTFRVPGAVLKNGRLCHYFPVIPRVYGELEILEF